MFAPRLRGRRYCAGMTVILRATASRTAVVFDFGLAVVCSFVHECKPGGNSLRGAAQDGAMGWDLFLKHAAPAVVRDLVAALV